jgi:hypothetical protein
MSFAFFIGRTNSAVVSNAAALLSCIMYSDLLLLAPALIGFFVLLWLRKKPHKASEPDAELPKNAIVVDGSNVMHWGGDPSAHTLDRVLRTLENKGFAPIVFFDANVGYVLDDSYYNEAKLASMIGTPAEHICVVSKGVVADEAILAFATDHGLRVVTNDQYRDWRVRFPLAGQRGKLLRGTWREGSVVWRGQL